MQWVANHQIEFVVMCIEMLDVTKQTWKDWLYETEKDMTLCSAGTVGVKEGFIKFCLPARY